MIQDWKGSLQTLERRITGDRETHAARLLPRLYSTLIAYGAEIQRELKENSSYSKRVGGLAAGHLCYLLGMPAEGEKFFAASIRLHEQDQKEEENEEDSLSSTLKFIVHVLDEFAPAQAEVYRERLTQKKKKKKHAASDPETVRQKIRHIEADIECAHGDIKEYEASARVRQAGLYLELGDQREAIRHYQAANGYYLSAHMRESEYVMNALAVIDCHLVLGEKAEAQQAFLSLLLELVPEATKPGDKLQNALLRNYGKFTTYFSSLDVDAQKIINHAEERLRSLQKERKIDHWELQELVNMLATEYAREEAYGNAVATINLGVKLGKRIKNTPYFSSLQRAEYYVKDGNFKAAKKMLAGELRQKTGIVGFEEKDAYDIAQLYLEMSEVDKGLDVLDTFCVRTKKGLMYGSYSNILNVRRRELDVFRVVIGDDYAMRVRNDTRGTSLIIAPFTQLALPEATMPKNV